MPPKKLDMSWRAQKLQRSSENSQEENRDDRVLEIGDDAPLSAGSSYEDSIRKQGPFVPNVHGERSMPETPPTCNTSTDAAASTNKPPKTPMSTSRQEELEMERRSAPEQNLTLFAMRLAVLEKLASNVGTLGFIWATVVLLGGYAVTLKEIDFWFVTVILVTEGARIFSRSHELELQHQDAGTASMIARAFQLGSYAFSRSSSVVRSVVSNKVIPAGEKFATSMRTDQLQSPNGASVDAVGKKNGRLLRRTWSTSNVTLVPFMDSIRMDWIFRASNVSWLLALMQVLSAMLTVVLSTLRLRRKDFVRPNEVDTGKNHSAALLIFYSLTVFEALVFLSERSYWQCQTFGKKNILIRVNDMCGLSPYDLNTTKHFFYDAYSKCLKESVFEGLKMDLVDFALTWLQSDILAEQFGGLRVLLTFSLHAKYSEDTLRTICTRQGAAERLLEMITWRNLEEQEIRKVAADLLCKLVKYNRNGIRVAAVTGSIESIFSLLSHDPSDADEMVPESTYVWQGGSEPIAHKKLATHLTGLRIMKHLAKDPLNCVRIGNTRGLLSRLVSFIDTDPQMLRNAEEPEHRIALVKKSLELLNLLAGMTGFGGKALRDEIVRVVYTTSNLRNILEYGEAHMMLQMLATETLTSLAMDAELREAIGRTGGILRNLFKLFLKERIEDDETQLKLAKKAGEALTLLALKNDANCSRMMKMKVRQGGVVMADEDGRGKEVTEVLIESMGDWEVGSHAISILRSFCAYSEKSEHQLSRARIAASIAKVVTLVMKRSGRTQEAALGLAARTVAEASNEDFEHVFSSSSDNVGKKKDLAGKLVDLLDRHQTPSTKLPHLRRFCLELAIALAQREPATFLPEFESQNFLDVLHRVADSTSDIENYYTFSDAVGVTPHKLHISQLVDRAVDQIRAYRQSLSSPLK